MILVCSICGASHYTQNCPEYAKGDHIEDKPSLNLSRSSVPNGLLIMDAADGSSCVVTSQKFAKGTRFGPLLAQKSYAPIKNIPFPLVLFATPYYYGSGGELDFDLQTLFNGRNVYLDTRNTNKCNWMIHVSLARFSNEQNLICYQENDEIYYTAIKDIELGDILRVWYSRSYAAKIGAALLEPSPYDICNNILRSVSLDYGLNLDQNQNYVDSFPSTSTAGPISQSAMMTGGGVGSGNDVNNNNNPTTTISTSGEMVSSYDKISLPPIDSLMKTSSPKYQSSHYHMFDLDLIASGHVSMQQQSCDDYGHFNPPSAAAIAQPMIHHSSQHHVAPEMQQQHHHHQHQQLPMQQPQQQQQQQQQQMVHSTYANYQTLPEDTLSPADLISISLGASDMNITFDSFGTNNLLGYDGGSSSGSNLGDSGISSVGFGGFQGGMESKLHSRYSSSTDSLATLNDSLGMVPPATPNLTSSTAPSSGTDPDADKKYPCEICLRKYMTKSNLDKHMRKHNLFLCVFCMKLFQLAEELKDHECTERKSKTAYLHCPKCLKVLSNSWSLQRHMKIHKDPNESVLMGSMEESTTDKLLMEPKEETAFDEIEPTPLDELKPSIDPLEGSSGDGMMMGDETCDVMNEPDPIRVQEMEIEPEYEAIQQPMVVAAASTSTIPINNTTSSQDMITDVQAPNGKQLYKCIVCAKLFKNPNALEKHLRKVHTVYTVSNDYKSEKKVMTQINQKKTSPIKPSIAKALATKLTQKSKKMEAAAASAESAVSPSVTVTPEQPVHVPRQYNKKKHLNKVATSSNAGGMQVSPLSVAPTIVTSSSGPTASSTPNKSHSIIIISNLELTNNNLIDTSQLFLNQNTNALGNKIDLKVLNSTDKLPKLVPISNHHQPASILPPATPQSVPTTQFQGATSIPTLHPTSALDGLNAIIESSGIVEESNQMMTESSSLSGTGETQLLTLSPIKNSNSSESQQMISVADRTPDSINNGFLSPEELSTDANDNSSSNQCCDGDSDNSAQLTQSSYPCEECDRVFPKNYQLKRHMEIHDSTYYMCPYCDRSPLKAKTSVRKHLNTVHPERAPAKEEMNKFISTLVVKDEKILRELYAKNERKIRNKCAKLQAKQLQQQQQLQQQHQQQLLENSVGIAEQHPTTVATSTAVSHVAAIQQQQQQHEAPTEMANVAPEEMLNAYQGSQQRSGGGEQRNGSEQHVFQTVEQMNRHGERVSANGGCNGEIKSGEEESALKRRSSEEQVNQGGQGGSSLREEGKKIKLVDVNGSEVRYIAATTMGGNGTLKYLRKKSLGVGEGSSSSGHSMPPPGSSSGSTMDNQIMLDNLFDNISIENYEFDDNTSIQSYNLIDERFKTSFDQIQEKLDAELSFDEEQLKWQNNLMTNDSSNEIGDKLLNVEENIMLI
ncbi:uncharacterized protein LOC135716545 isoform X2 [Ochlerotatus camptorhynchus]|uniref:uncharacterized protein LOC135716545 isoform X2 n=1 Tax=Ochlerotatus camptorhynchus TaxID=644619 RepID=UPI0031D5F6BD